MPRERRSLQGGEVIANKANWTNEEVIAWIDNDNKRGDIVYDTLESEFRGNGGRQVLGSSREIWRTIEETTAKEAEKYIM
jgi:hypothetical protein